MWQGCSCRIAQSRVAERKNEFLRKYGFMPDVIGLGKATVTEVTVGASHRVNACNLHGVYGAPGAHVFMDKEEHFVIEIGNAYYPLKRA